MKRMSKKAEAFVSHMMEECETRGLTLDEVKQLPAIVNSQVSLYTREQEKTVKFKNVSHEGERK